MLPATCAMSDAVCLIGDDSGPLRSLMRQALIDAGYRVLQAESSNALASQVHDPTLISAGTMLLVLGGRWAAQCAVPISVAATMRHQMTRSPACLVLLYELGTLGLIEKPELHHCRTVAMLEKPFEMAVLRGAACAAAAQSEAIA